MSCEIIILGDICPDSNYTDWFSANDVEKVFHDVLPLINNSDYTIANLEAPVTLSTHKLNKNSINLKADPDSIKLLADSGINALSLANNHILDYGIEGLEDTISYLNYYGIAYYGIADKDNTVTPLFIKAKDMVIGVMAFAEQEFNCAVDYGKGASKWDDIDSLLAIREAKDNCDYLIIQYHGGIENYIYPSPLLQKRCRAMAEAGADFVACQHSHVIGTKECWKGTEILYGQGNTVFGYSDKNGYEWNRGLICKVTILKDDNGVTSQVAYIPIVSTECGEYLAEKELKKKIIDEFNIESSKISDSSFTKDKWRVFCEKQSTTYLPMLFGWNINMIRANKLFSGRLIDIVVKSNQLRNSMNIIRCISHREVIETILEEKVYN